MAPRKRTTTVKPTTEKSGGITDNLLKHGLIAAIIAGGDKLKTLFDGFSAARTALEEKDPELIHEAGRLMLHALRDHPDDLQHLQGWCNTTLHHRKLGGVLQSIKHKGETEDKTPQQPDATKGGLTPDQQIFVTFIQDLVNIGQFDQAMAERMLDNGYPVKGDTTHRFNNSVTAMRERIRAAEVAQERPTRWWR